MPRLFLLLLLSFCLSASADDECVNAQEKRITMMISEDPPSLDTMNEVTQIGQFIQGHVFEGLMSIDKDQHLVPGVAETYEWLPGNLGLRFKLRKDAKWSDGKAVTAHDFVFAWRQGVSPVKANPYFFIMLYLKNAEKINQKKLPITELGVKAIDDYTLEVQLEKPCPFFLNLTTFVSYMPCREDFFTARVVLNEEKTHYTTMKYASEPENLLCNGPFKLSQWEKRTRLTLEKNDQYWNRDKIRLNTIIVKVIGDQRTAFDLFRSKQLASCTLTDETMKKALEIRLPLSTYADGGFAYLEFNHRQERADDATKLMLGRNKNFRKAIYLAIPTSDIVNRIIGVPGFILGNSIIPHCISGKKLSWPEEHPLPIQKPNAAQAREYLEKARLELKLENFPSVDLLVTDDPRTLPQGEYLQYILAKNLGLKINLDIQTFKHRLKKQAEGSFDIAMTNWAPDYDDPMTYADLMTTSNENNRGRYRSPEYDKIIADAQNCADPDLRNQLFDQAQKHIRDHAVIVPIFERATVYVVHKQLKGVTRTCLGADPCLIHAWIEEAGK